MLDRASPRFGEIVEAFKSLPAFGPSFWTEDCRQRIDFTRFRGHAYYLSQGYQPAEFYAAASWAASKDRRLLESLTEDDAFGATIEAVGGRAVSRDLLDSFCELHFLRDELRPDLSVLDIGAGYGRFAHRLTAAMPGAWCYCVDGVPESSYLAEYYLRFRGVDRARVVLPDSLDSLPPCDLAVNSHSFNECSLSAIKFWLDYVNRRHIPLLFLVTHPGLDFQLTDQRGEFRHLVEAAGFALVRSGYKYGSPDIPALSPETRYWLFRKV